MDIALDKTNKFCYTYAKLISRTGSSFVIFGYNGRDGVVTDDNGLIYMRARYYSPEMKRFINADIVKGEITNAVTLNRYAYANANPVSNVDPLGLRAVSQFNTVCVMDGGGSGITSSLMLKDSTDTSVGDWVDENIIQPVSDFISENVELGANFGVEKVGNIVNHQFGQTEYGTGYSKDFNTGKPINIVMSSSANSLNGGSWGLGVDFNFDGYGMGITVGEDVSLSAHLGSLSIEFGHSETSLYFKTATKVDGAYIYQRDTFDYKDFGNAVEEVVSEAVPYIGAVVVAVVVLFVVSIPLGNPVVPVV